MLDTGLYLASEDTKVHVIGDAIQTMLDVMDQEDYPQIYMNDTDVLISYCNSIIGAQIQDGNISKFQRVSDEGFVRSADSSAIYYIAGQYRFHDYGLLVFIS